MPFHGECTVGPRRAYSGTHDILSVTSCCMRCDTTVRGLSQVCSRQTLNNMCSHLALYVICSRCFDGPHTDADGVGISSLRGHTVSVVRLQSNLRASSSIVKNARDASLYQISATRSRMISRAIQRCALLRL